MVPAASAATILEVESASRAGSGLAGTPVDVAPLGAVPVDEAAAGGPVDWDGLDGEQDASRIAAEARTPAGFQLCRREPTLTSKKRSRGHHHRARRGNRDPQPAPDSAPRRSPGARRCR